MRLNALFRKRKIFPGHVSRIFACRKFDSTFAFLIGVVLLAMMISGCGGGDDPCEDPMDFTTVLQERYNAWYEAENAYNNDPTPANCQNYKNAFRAYWNYNLDVGDCAGNIIGLPFGQVLSESELEATIAQLCP